jgi:methionyl-tRNA formyltransferase
MLKTVILASGALGLKTTQKLQNDCKIIAVLTDKGSKDLIDWSKANGIPVFVGNPRENKGSNFLSGLTFELMLSINYLFIIEKDLINLPEKYALNIHGSLLPKNRGRTPHVWAIIHGETETGITIHEITEGCDEGDIVLQKKLPIPIDATGSSILDQFNANYYPMLKEIIQRIEQNELNKFKQDETQATWNGKRTPEDGEINWSWNPNRIYNWVRAQTNPYPGAFTYLNGKKLTIDWVKPAHYDSGNDRKDGTIVSTDPTIVKCKDGFVELVKVREATKFRVGQSLKSEK